MEPIKEAIIRISKDADGFYNGHRALVPGYNRAQLAMIVGARRIGKTQFFVHLMCDVYQNYGITTLWLRNRVVEIQELGAEFLNDAKRFGWCPDEWEVRADGVYTHAGKGADRVCFFKAVSTFDNSRGSSYSSKDHPCLLAVFDEFMPESRRYPPNCVTGLISLLKTVFSNDPRARCYMLSNSISAINPYMARLRVYYQNIVTYYDDKSILIEKCVGYRQANMSPDNPWVKVYQAAQYADYADEKEDARWQLIVKTLPKGAKPSDWLIKSNGNLYRAWVWNGMYYFSEYNGKLAGTYTVTSERQEVNSHCMYMSSNFRNALMELFDTASARFVGANCMFDVLNSVFEYGL